MGSSAILACEHQSLNSGDKHLLAVSISLDNSVCGYFSPVGRVLAFLISSSLVAFLVMALLTGDVVTATTRLWRLNGSIWKSSSRGAGLLADEGKLVCRSIWRSICWWKGCQQAILISGTRSYFWLGGGSYPMA